ncbi:GA-binding protein subunit beta-1-like [Lates calcarifer]|uniref:GA-binding protein subunit beta-1-like n=1 Tax=Lates calcarifer TaxID=8187 RepID=A0AAJ7LTD1_LATCA|nr:GA-binding protein subunit beta-1-like [Lates calcarifer]
MASGAAFSTDWLGSSPLHLAALYSHHSTMGVLLGCPNQGGQDPPPEGCTILVALGPHASVQNSANINAKDIPKMTALH